MKRFLISDQTSAPTSSSSNNIMRADVNTESAAGTSGRTPNSKFIKLRIIKNLT